MRKVTEQAKAALKRGGSMATKNNTRVEDGVLYLHGHKIFWKEGGKQFFSMCGYGTLTTRERINGVLPSFIRKGNLYYYVGLYQQNNVQCFAQFVRSDMQEIIVRRITEIDPEETYCVEDMLTPPTLDEMLDARLGIKP